MQRLTGTFTFREADGGFGTVTALAVTGGTPRHVHERLVVGLVDAGARIFSLPDGPVRAGPGHVFVLPPSLPHACAPDTEEDEDGDGGPCSYRLLCLPAGLLQASAALVTRADARLRADFAQAFRAVNSASSDDMGGGSSGDTSGAADAIDEMLRGLAALLPPGHAHPAEGSRDTGGPVRAALLFIAENAGEEMVMEDVARAAGLSPFHLHRLFAEQTGLTPREFRETVRLRLARRGIERGLPPAEAAALAGFYDQSHLSRAFRRHMGCTPGSYASGLASPGPEAKKHGTGVDGRRRKG